ncbi:MAG: YceI family protein [Sphingomonadales bacterium]|jgi:polyisoprenoid-binding protein YceI|nr:YceI family protein [Sphingomonadales bacterium]
MITSHRFSRRSAALMVLGLGLAMTPLGAAVESADPSKSPAGAYVMDASHTSVGARVSHLGFSTTTVNFPKISGSLTWDPAKPETSSLDVTMDATAVYSGWEARDNHIKGEQFFNVAKFPTITYKAASLTKLTATTARVDGTLTLLGISKPVPMTVTFVAGGKGMMGDIRIGLTGKASLKRTDFGMTAFAPAVGDEIDITIDTEFSKKP